MTERAHAHAREFKIGDTVFARKFGQGDNWVHAAVTARTGVIFRMLL